MGFSAPLDLPQGSHITKATCYAFDYDAAVSHTIECGLEEYVPVTGQQYDLNFANSSTPNSSPDVRALKMIDPGKTPPVVVDNIDYQYRIWMSFDQGTSAILSLYGVVVETGYQTFLPTIRR